MKLRPFELVLALGFGILAFAALILMMTYRPANQTVQNFTQPVVIWGFLDSSAVMGILDELAREDVSIRNVSYTQIDPASFDERFITALADGAGPDVVLIPHEKLVQYRPRLRPFSYDRLPLPDFQRTYIDGTEVFAMTDGIYAIPVAIDPLVLYANRDILATFNFANPPATWEMMVNDYVPTLVQRNFSREIIRSPLAFGEYRNVQNGFAIISLLLLQRGSLMVTEEAAGRYVLALNTTRDGDVTAFSRVVDFYTNFANPSNPLYTWNRSLPLDRQAFLSENLVFYFGKGSEARSIARQNPNLNFTVAEVPQGATATIRRTYGTFYGFAVVRNSQNVAGAERAIQLLVTEAAQTRIASELGLAPVSRNLLMAGSNDVYGRTIYSAATVARGWWSPDPRAVDSIFTTMVEDVLANRARPIGAANDAIGRLENVY